MTHPLSNGSIALAVSESIDKILTYDEIDSNMSHLASVTTLEGKLVSSENKNYKFEFQKGGLITKLYIELENIENIVNITCDKKYTFNDLLILDKMHDIIQDNIICLETFINSNTMLLINLKSEDNPKVYYKCHLLNNKLWSTFLSKKININKYMTECYNSCEKKDVHEIFLSNVDKKITDIIITQKVVEQSILLDSIDIYCEESIILKMSGYMSHAVVPKIQGINCNMISKTNDGYLKHYLISFGEYTTIKNIVQNYLNMEKLSNTTMMIYGKDILELTVTCIHY